MKTALPTPASKTPAPETSIIKTAAVDIQKLKVETPKLDVKAAPKLTRDKDVSNKDGSDKAAITETSKETATVKPEPVKTASLEKPAPKLVKAEASPKAITEAIAAAPPPSKMRSLQTRVDMQLNLSKLGLYSGEISGTVGPKTKASITEFKQLFGLPSGTEMTDDFLAELQNAVDSSAKRAEQQRLILEAEKKQAIMVAAAEPVTPSPVYEFIPAQIETSKPAAQTVLSAAITQPAPNVKTPAADSVAQAVQASGTISQTASLTRAAPKTVSQIDSLAKPTQAPAPEKSKPEKVVEAKRIGGVSLDYPSKALRRGFDRTVTVQVQYDVSKDGVPKNLRIENVSNVPGRFKDSFEDAAMSAVKQMRFTPKTVNSEPVISESNKTRIKFQMR